MCTVSFFPLDEGYVLTANRDESPLRQAIEVGWKLSGEKRIWYPREPMAGGTNLAIAGPQSWVCLLNGAFEAHKHRPPYSRSRGRVVLEAFDYDSLSTFFIKTPLYGVEPFTIVALDHHRLYDFRWDGNTKHLVEVNPAEPRIWASAKLYDNVARENRVKWFDASRKSILPLNNNAQEVLWNFHLKGGSGDIANDMVMNRNGIVQTVSITQLCALSIGSEIKHLDLLNNQEVLHTLDGAKN